MPLLKSKAIEKPCQKKTQGYTLIEIMIALMIFTIISAITSMALYQSFQTRQRVEEQANWLNDLQFAIAHLQRDTQQIIERTTLKPDMKIAPAFIGQINYTEFTRDGVISPNAKKRLSTLNRIAYTCKNGQLIRNVWRLTDPVDLKPSGEKILLNQLVTCKFAYLSHKRQLLSEWRDQTLNHHEKSQRAPIPIAIQLILKFKNHGEMHLLFTLPESLYG